MTELQFLTIAQAANLLSLHPTTVRRMFDAGQLTGIRIGSGKHRRILRASAEALMDLRAQETAWRKEMARRIMGE